MKEIITSKVKHALAETLKLKSADSITMESRLKDDLGLDSMSSLTFLMELEDSIPGFSVNADTLDADHLSCVASITNYVMDSLKKADNHV